MLLVGMYAGTAIMKSRMEVPQKIKKTYDPAIPHLGIYPEKMRSRSPEGICIADLFTIDEWTKKMWYVFYMFIYIHNIICKNILIHYI